MLGFSIFACCGRSQPKKSIVSEPSSMPSFYTETLWRLAVDWKLASEPLSWTTTIPNEIAGDHGEHMKPLNCKEFV